MWKVGTTERISRRWNLDGVPISTGTANARIFARTSSGLRYLQADLTTLGATPVDHALAYDAALTFWILDLVVPAAFKGLNVTARVTHSDPETTSRSEEHYVVESDTDDVEDTILETHAENLGEHDDTQDRILQIQNNTRFVTSLPSRLTRPESGTEAIEVDANLYDTAGAMEDPDNAEILVRIRMASGAFITDRFYKAADLAVALDNPTDTVTFPVAEGWRALERDNVGAFFAFYKSASAATEEVLTVEFAVTEGGLSPVYWPRSLTITDAADLDSILEEVQAIRETDVPAIQQNIDAEGTSTRNLVQAETDALDASVAGVRGVVDAIRATDVPAIQSQLTALSAALDSARTAILNAIAESDADAGETADVGGTSTAGSRAAKLNALLTQLAALQETVDDLQIEPAVMEFGPS